MSETMKGKTLLKGHSLYREGDSITMGWHGQGKCSCGAISEFLSSNNARKRWHSQHKAELRKELAEAKR